MYLLDTIFSFLTRELTVLLMAVLPIIELRGAIPVGISMGMSPLHAFIVSFIGSILPSPFIIYAIRPVFKLLAKVDFLKGFIESITNRTMGKSDIVKKYGFWGLMIFVAIPLPGTGVWSGSLLAVLLDMRVKIAFPAIFIGNLIAGILIMGISHGAFRTIDFLAPFF